MKQRRYEFSKETKLKAWLRSSGVCECGCGHRIEHGNGPEYHHQYKPATEPGSDSLDNCQVLRKRPCHDLITHTETIPMQAKQKRTFEKRINAGIDITDRAALRQWESQRWLETMARIMRNSGKDVADWT